MGQSAFTILIMIIVRHLDLILKLSTYTFTILMIETHLCKPL
jgi:hypothetical protein